MKQLSEKKLNSILKSPLKSNKKSKGSVQNLDDLGSPRRSS